MLKYTEEPWEHIRLDFMSPLLESENMHGKLDMICVVTDYATSMIRITSTKQTYGTKDISNLMI